MRWLIDNFSTVVDYSKTHLYLALLPLLIGLLIAVPVGTAIRNVRWLRRITLTLASIAFTIPSLALFVTIPQLFGLKTLDPLNVVIALSVYATALLIRAVPEALDSVPDNVIDASTAVGFTPLRRALTVELPLALPVMIANIRVIAVTNISLVSVGSLIGIGGLGVLFKQGYDRDYPDQIVAGIIAIVALALALDLILYLIGRFLTPWTRTSTSSKVPRRPVGRGGTRMSIFTGAWDFIVDPGNWSGDTGIGTRILQHLWYSVLAVALSAVIAVPIGLLIGHLRRGEIVVVSLVNALRSLPTLGLLTFLVLLMGLGVMPPILALVILGIPPLLAGTYAGIASVDRGVVEAARAMGMTELQVLFRVEIPNALPLILGGLRNATLQVIATATVAAYVNLGGLGRYIFDGLALYKYDRVVVGAILVAVVALVVDGLLALVVWASVPGTGRLRRTPDLTRL